ncbi:MAG: response regulator transcription factor [Flavobacteriales bacterium]|nr:response regulator transcription factor [Flavobacteriales bacterium]
MAIKQEPCDIIIVEDDKGIREALCKYLGRDKENFSSVCAFDSIEKMLLATWNHKMPVFLLDINLPGLSGIEGIPMIKERVENAEIIMISVLSDTQSIFNAICAGASGYIDKEVPLSQIKESILALRQGGSPITPSIARKVFDYFQPQNQVEEQLTDREQSVVRGIVDGLSYKLIADRLGISIDTVRKYIKSVYGKLHINSKGELIAKYHKARS